MRTIIYLGALALGLPSPLQAQATTDATGGADPVLFSVDDTPVHVSEFDYIYAKTNGDSADYSKSSLEEYLELYRRFKLKVAAARQMGLDTVPALQQELEGYRRQLADSYLVDQDVTEPLARELYDRNQRDVRVEYITVTMPGQALDTTAGYQLMDTARQLLVAGQPVDTVVAFLKRDTLAQGNGGDIGFVAAPLPPGLYDLETAIFETPTGEVSRIIRTENTYHVIKPVEERAARGEIEAAHIFVRKPNPEDPEAVMKLATARKRIDSIYVALQTGGDFEKIATATSEDTRSAPRGGYVGFFGINRYEPAFENAAFGIEQDSTYAAPVETNVGFHIIRKLSAREQPTWEVAKPDLMERVKRMPRFEEMRRRAAARLRAENGFEQDEAALERFAGALPDTFTSYRWVPAEEGQPATLFELGGAATTTADLNAYLTKNASQRTRLAGTMPPDQIFDQLYGDFLLEKTTAFGEDQLEEDNAAFRNLMREYREGILLFEATKQSVWDKAGLDTAGLEAYFAEHREDYVWGERVVVDEYTFSATDSADLAATLPKFAKKRTPEEVLAKYNATDSARVTHARKTLERGRDEAVDALKWRKGEATAAVPAPGEEGKVRIVIVREKLAPSPKELSEARGYVIADYQDELERRWVERLGEDHEVETNQAAFDALVR